MYLAFKNLKIDVQKVNSRKKGKTKVRMILFDAKMQDDSWR